jgi:hypothetical protein
VVNTDIKLISKLPRKWDQILYDFFKGAYSKSHIRNVVVGNRNNIKILEQAVILAEEHQKHLLTIKNKIMNLNNN